MRELLYLKVCEYFARAKKIGRHKNIVNLIEFNENGTREKSTGEIEFIMYAVWETDYVGNLFGFLVVGYPLPEEICKFYFKQMLSAMHAVHSVGLVHNKVRPGTFFVDKHFNLRLSLFIMGIPIGGLKGSDKLEIMKRHQPYMAPEWHAEQQLSKSGDLFALAVLLFFMMIGSLPFYRAVPSERLYRFICRGDFNLFWTHHLKRDLSKESKNLLYQLFQHNPKHRLPMVAL